VPLRDWGWSTPVLAANPGVDLTPVRDADFVAAGHVAPDCNPGSPQRRRAHAKPTHWE